MKIGRITSIEADGPRRNVVMTDSPDAAYCSIAIPAKSVIKSTVNSFQLHGTRVGYWLVTALLVVLVTVSCAIHQRFAFSSLTICALVLCVGYLIARYHSLTLYSVIVHTRDPITPRISFYRTFEAFDFALALDWLTWSVGDHPRTCTGVVKQFQEREL